MDCPHDAALLLHQLRRLNGILEKTERLSYDPVLLNFAWNSHGQKLLDQVQPGLQRAESLLGRRFIGEPDFES